MRTIIAIVTVALLSNGCTRDTAASTREALLTPRDVELVDHRGKPFRLADLSTPSFVFLGYTRCPDACPTMLAKLSRVYTILGENDAKRIRTLFISVDPRDDTKELAKYLAYFSSIPATGLTGNKAQIDHAVKQFAAFYEFVDSKSEAGTLVNHTTSLYLLDENQRVVELFSHHDTPETIATKTRGLF